MMEIQWLGWAVYLLVGALAGLMAGLLGVGGGMIVVPALIWLLPSAGVSDAHLMQVSLGTSLAAIVMTSISSARAHHKKGAVQWPLVKWLSPGVIAGAMLSGTIAAFLSTPFMIMFFAMFAALIAARLLFAPSVTVVALPPNHRWPAWGGVIGVISGLVGIGGGSLTVPLLLHYGVPTVNAVATSAAVGLPIAIGGTIGYIVAGWNLALPSASVGFVYLPAVLGITLASWFSAPLGVRLAHHWPAAKLKKVFAVFLLVVSARLFWRAFFD